MSWQEQSQPNLMCPCMMKPQSEVKEWSEIGLGFELGKTTNTKGYFLGFGTFREGLGWE